MSKLLQKDGTRVILTHDTDYVDNNPQTHRTPIVPTGAWGAVNAEYDEELMIRLTSNFKQMDDSCVSGLWSQITQDHRPFIQLLMSDQYKEAFDILANLHQSALMNGMSQGVWDTPAIKGDPDVAMIWLKRHWDTLLSLCEYTSVINIQNREQGVSSVIIPIDRLIEGLAQKLAAQLPDFRAPLFVGGIWGLDTHKGIFTERCLAALYVALKISSKFPTDAKIVEIGGGAGFVIYWLYQLGYRDLTMVDLPSVSIGQAFNLATNLGKENIRLAYETHDAPVKFMTPDQFNASNEMIDLVYNSDSMPEMGNEHLVQYLATIARTAKSFLSINHELRNTILGVAGNVVSHEVITRFPEAIINLERNRYWLREGYVEEFYVTQHWS